MKPFYCFLLIVLSSFLAACNKPIPKPNGYFRIETPETRMVKFDTVSAPFTFDYPSFCDVKFINTSSNSGSLVITYPAYSAKILCNYNAMKPNDFRVLAEENRQFVYRHSIKASAINEEFIPNNRAQTYGVLYELKGNVATSFQFSVTDSLHHYLRGSLYIESTPKADSLAPVTQYIKGHLKVLISSLRWKNN